MADDVLKRLLECGVHFGHQTRRWNPKMKRFIFGERSGIYIIDLEKTKEYLLETEEHIKTLVARGGKILFVGTKKQAKDVVANEAQRAGMPYVNNRWLGGLLTNFQTVRKSIDKLTKIEKMMSDGVASNLKKKEVSRLNKEKEKLLRDLGGIREMTEVPQAVFIIDSRREDIAVKEAYKLKIPIVGLIDTNCDPDFIDFPIPGNDDALKSIRYITSVIADAIIQGKKEYQEAKMIQSEKSSEVDENVNQASDSVKNAVESLDQKSSPEAKTQEETSTESSSDNKKESDDK